MGYIEAMHGRGPKTRGQGAERRILSARARAAQGDLEGCEKDYLAAARTGDPALGAEAAEWLITAGEADRRRLILATRLCRKARSGEMAPGVRTQLLVLEGTALNQLGDHRAALERLVSALRRDPESIPAARERAVATFELCRFDEAERLFTELVRRAPDEAWGHHYLGLIAERRGRMRRASACFALARRLGATVGPRVSLSPAEFDRALQEAMERIPPMARSWLAGVPVAVEPVPGLADLMAVRPPLSPSILGLLRGPPLDLAGERSVVLYQRNLERFARSREELIEQIALTLLHEIGHLLGLSEAALWARGLE